MELLNCMRVISRRTGSSLTAKYRQSVRNGWRSMNSIHRQYGTLRTCTKLHVGLTNIRNLSVTSYAETRGKQQEPETTRTYKLIILDKNGTLIDFHSRWTPWVKDLSKRIKEATGKNLIDKIYEALDVCTFTHKARQGVLGQGTTWEMKCCLEHLLESEGYIRRHAQLIVEQTWSDCDPSAPNSLKPVTDLYAFIMDLKTSGYKVAVNTSDNRKHTEWVLNKLGISSLIDYTLCSDDIKTIDYGSGTGSQISHICKTVGIPESNTVVVGDTPNDMQLGKEADVALKVGVLTGIGSRLDLYPYSDIIIDTVSDLKSTLQKAERSRSKDITASGPEKSQPKKGASLVIFDKDGTLIDFEKMWTPYLKEFVERLEDATGIKLEKSIFDEFGYCHETKRWGPGLYAEGTGEQQKDKVIEVLQDKGYSGDPHKVVEESWGSADHSDSENLHIIDNPKSLFKALKDKGIKVAVCTADSRSNTEQFLKSHGLEEYVDCTVCGDDEDSKPKPSPYNALSICEKLDVEPAQAVVVGDTVADLGMGKSAKLGATVGVLSGIGRVTDLDHCADHLIPSIKHITSIVIPKEAKSSLQTVKVSNTSMQTQVKKSKEAMVLPNMTGIQKKSPPGGSQIAGYHTLCTQISSNRMFNGNTNFRRGYSTTDKANFPSYTYVIVGAGSAGCVLANRLSSDSQNSVMLLEAGPKDYSWKIKMPAALMYNLCDDKYNWYYHTVPQQHMDNRVMYQPRGRVWGGSSSLNAMAYVRGHALDYDRWEKEGAEAWSYADCLPYFKKAQTHEYGENDYRGGSGPLHVSRGSLSNPLYKAWVDAGIQAGYPFTEDMNGFQQEGMGYMDMTIHKGQRWSAAVAYLYPALSRSNLSTLTGVLGSRILFEGNKAVGIEYEQNGQAKQVRAEKEVILCGGAFNSPQLLNLSGIGNADHLKSLDIPVQTHLPGVGENLQDHLEIYIQQECLKPITLFKYQWKYPWNMIPAGARWFLFKSGICTSSHLEAGGFIRSRPHVPHPDIQYHFLPSVVVDHGRKMGDRHAYQAHVGPMRSTSRGHLRLKSKNPKESPLIDFNYMSNESDKEEMRACVRLTREIMAQKAFDEFRGKELTPGPDVKSNEQIDAWVRKMADTAYHPSCTCKIGDESDPMAVVNSKCQVLGTEGLRVVDASIMPSVVSGNLNAPTIMIAEKAADIILGKPPLPRSNAPVYQPKTLETQR